MNICDKRKYIIKQPYDVIIVGGGIAGISAAVSAARKGVKTLLMEKSIVLGGLATSGLISWYEPLCDSAGTKMISGIAEELLRLSIRYGFDDLPDIWEDGNNANKKPGRYATHYSPTIFSMALDTYLEENGVSVIFDCMAVFPVMEGGRCAGIAAEAKEGCVFYPAKAVIDATGDASVFYQAGLPTINGENYMTYIAQGYDQEDVEQYNCYDDPSVIHLRKWRVAGSNLFGVGHPEGMKKVVGITSEEITEYVLTGRRMLFQKIKDQDRNTRDLSMIPFMPQLRTIRHIVGEYEFVAVDGECFEDTIGSCGDFRREIGVGKHYHIPYRSLYCSECANIIAAGRIISSSGDGWEVSRVIPVCALTGQAAGTAAAQAVKTGCSFADLDVKKLQKNLMLDGVLFV